MRTKAQRIKNNKRKEHHRMQRKARRLNIKKHGYPKAGSNTSSSTMNALMGILKGKG